MEDVLALTKQIKHVHDRLIDECKDGETVDEAACALLQLPVCMLARLVVPNFEKKANEIIYACQNDLLVNQAQHGADLLTRGANGAKSHIEHKKSQCTRSRRYCNFNWPLPPAHLPAEKRRQKLLLSILEKTGGPEGHAILEVVSGLGKVIASYKLSGAFLYQYFSRVALGKSDVHNMGCARCKTCGGFHRVQRLQHYSQLLDSKGQLTEAEWSSLFSKCNTHCNTTTTNQKSS